MNKGNTGANSNSPVKKISLRKCVGCNEMKPKCELIRIVKSAQGEVNLDFTGKKSGRGAYICKNIDCFTKAKKARRLERAFSMKIINEIYDNLERELNNNE